MEPGSSRLTRAAIARLGQRKHEPGEFTTVHKKPGWASSIVDSIISRRLGGPKIQNNAEMAPGTALSKKKALFTANRTSFNSAPRKISKEQSEGTRDSSPNESNLTPEHTVVIPSNRDQPVAPAKSSCQQSHNQSSGKKTKSTSPLTKSTGNRKQSNESNNPITPEHNVVVPSNQAQPVAPAKSSCQQSHNQSTGKKTKSTSHLTKSTGNKIQSNESNLTPEHTVVAPSNQAQPVAPTKSSLRQSHNQSTGEKTQSTSPPTNSTASSSPHTPSKTYPVLTDSPSFKSLIFKPQPAIPTPVKSRASQDDPVGHSLDETDLDTQDTTNDTQDTTNDTQDTTNDDSNETEISNSKPKRKRGPTMGKGLMKAISGSNGKRLKIEVDPTIGRPKSRIQSAKFSSEVGVVARDVLQIPKKWKDVDVKTALEPAFDHMQIHMELDLDDPGVKQSVIERLKNSSRQQRHRMHKHFKQYANVEEAKKNKPSSIADQAHWEILCDYFDSEKFKNQSRANTKNRKQVQSKHTTGRTPFIIIQDEISRKNGQKCSTIELYKSTHQNAKGEWLSTASKNNWELMIESQQKYADDGIDITEEEIMAQVLGPGNGYVKGQGYGLKPPGKHNTYLQQQLLEKQAELEEAKTDNAAYKVKVDVLTEKLSNQEEKIAQLMAFMTACGRSTGSDEKDDSD